jgi:hypothetical protein
MIFGMIDKLLRVFMRFNLKLVFKISFFSVFIIFCLIFIKNNMKKTVNLIKFIYKII